MEILLLRTWLPNIGNGFIDMGAKRILRRAAPNAHIYEVSGYPNYAADRIAMGQLAGMNDVFGSKAERLKDALRRRRSAKGSMVNVAEYIDADLAVLPGCILYKHALVKYEDVLRSLHDRGIDIVFLGAGGGDYTPETRTYVANILDEIEAVALLTRDRRAYECYESAFEFAYDGIDCAFFIDDWYTPPDPNERFAVFTFDKQAEPTALAAEYDEVIRPDHVPFGHSLPFDGCVPTMWDKYKTAWRRTNKNVFLSDSLTDYLFWYANADVTHADRVHACIPALAFGNRAQFHYETPRASLFEQVPVGRITERPVSLDRSKLDRIKESQVSAMAEALDVASA
jgi:hypothetical protein